MYIFDLDGTLFDVWKRYFEVFNSWWKINGLGLGDFITLKRKLVRDELIVREYLQEIPEKLFRLYKEHKKQKLESLELLKLDKEIFDPDMLRKLDDFIVLTVRRNPSNLFFDLQRRNLGFLLKKTVVLEPKDSEIKFRWVSQHLEQLLSKDGEVVVVGDSETDLLIGQLEQVSVVLVRTGLREPQMLLQEFAEKCKRNVSVVESVNDLLRYP